MIISMHPFPTIERVDGTIKSEEGFLEELSFDLEFQGDDKYWLPESLGGYL